MPSRRGSAPPTRPPPGVLRMVDTPLDCAANDTVCPRLRKPASSGSFRPLLLMSICGLSPPTPVVGLLAAPKFTSDVACCAFRFQSSAPTTVLTTNWMMDAPPGEPVAIRKSPREPSAACLNTSVGAMELRGRFSAVMRLAIGPLASDGSNEKSVSWLLSKNPRVK